MALGQTLARMYNTANNNEKVIMIHLFGIKYGDVIISNGYDVKSILKYASMNASYYTEVRKGIRLARYVEVKEDNAHDD